MKKAVVKYRLIRSLMPLLFIWYMVSISSFYHSHNIGGVKVNHSHPFSAEHQHSQNQIDTITLLSALSALGDILPNIELDALFSMCGVLLFLVAPLFIERISNRCKSLRAPPVLSIAF